MIWSTQSVCVCRTPKPNDAINLIANCPMNLHTGSSTGMGIDCNERALVTCAFSSISSDLDKLKEGIAEKLIMFVYLVMTFVFSIAAAFVYGWKLTLVTLSCAPLIIISSAIVAKVLARDPAR